jgi:hypothetical protein
VTANPGNGRHLDTYSLHEPKNRALSTISGSSYKGAAQSLHGGQSAR